MPISEDDTGYSAAFMPNVLTPPADAVDTRTTGDKTTGNRALDSAFGLLKDPDRPAGVPPEAHYVGPGKGSGSGANGGDAPGAASDAGWAADAGNGYFKHWDASGKYLGSFKDGGNFIDAVRPLAQMAATAAAMYTGVGLAGGASGAEMAAGYGGAGAGADVGTGLIGTGADVANVANGVANVGANAATIGNATNAATLAAGEIGSGVGAAGATLADAGTTAANTINATNVANGAGTIAANTGAQTIAGDTLANTAGQAMVDGGFTAANGATLNAGNTINALNTAGGVSTLAGSGANASWLSQANAWIKANTGIDLGGTATAVNQWIRDNPLLATAIGSGISNASNNSAKLDQINAQTQGQINIANNAEANKLAENARTSASVKGLRSNLPSSQSGLINNSIGQAPLTRSTGQAVFSGNGLINRA